MGSRLTRTPRFTSRGFVSKGRVVRRVCDGAPERLGSLPRNREQRSVLGKRDSTPKLLLVAPKCRERLKAVNRSGGAELCWLTAGRGVTGRRAHLPGGEATLPHRSSLRRTRGLGRRRIHWVAAALTLAFLAFAGVLFLLRDGTCQDEVRVSSVTRRSRTTPNKGNLRLRSPRRGSPRRHTGSGPPRGPRRPGAPGGGESWPDAPPPSAPTIIGPDSQ
jgi:hypothetical protein